MSIEIQAEWNTHKEQILTTSCCVIVNCAYRVARANAISNLIIEMTEYIEERNSKDFLLNQYFKAQKEPYVPVSREMSLTVIN